MAKNNAVNEDEFPSNSHTQRVPMNTSRHTRNTIEEDTDETRKRLKPVVKHRGVVREKSFLQNILGEDSRSVGRYILYEVLIPAAKETITEMFSRGVEMFMYGEARGGGGRRRDSERGRSYVSYGSYYRGESRRDEERRESRHSHARERFSLDDIVFKDGREAADVLEALCDELESYDQVTVADFYDLAGVERENWTDQKWGWRSLKKAYCSTTRGGYVIVFPEPIELD